MVAAPPPEPYAHYRATEHARVVPGVYRVVGTDAESVALLRVADGDGRRVTDGEVRSVPREHLSEAFADAENPDAGLRPGAAIEGLIEGGRAVVGWLGRLFGRG